MSRRLGQTPSQTIGPFYSIRLGGEGQNLLATPDESGERIVLTGKVLDAGRDHIEDALLEFWQADPEGSYNHPEDGGLADGGFTGFARSTTDFETGRYVVETVRPGRVPGPGGDLQAPHLTVIIQARGMLNPVFTRIYFSDETQANREDAVLGAVPESRRTTMISELEPGSDPKTFYLDFRFQGDDETVFLQY